MTVPHTPKHLAASFDGFIPLAPFDKKVSPRGVNHFAGSEIPPVPLKTKKQRRPRKKRGRPKGYKVNKKVPRGVTASRVQKETISLGLFVGLLGLVDQFETKIQMEFVNLFEPWNLQNMCEIRQPVQEVERDILYEEAEPNYLALRKILATRNHGIAYHPQKHAYYFTPEFCANLKNLA